MGKLDDMKAAANKGKNGPVPKLPKSAAPRPLTEQKTPKVAPPIRVACTVECVNFQCGCQTPVDRLQSESCERCRNEARRKRLNAKRDKKERARSEAANVGTFLVPYRLPDGSVKNLVWKDNRWTGTLVVPGVQVTFTFTTESEKVCFHGLHGEYVKWLASSRATGEKGGGS